MAEPNYSRRDFLESIGNLAGGSAVYRAALALGLTTATTACGSSSAADSSTDTSVTVNPGTTTPTDTVFVSPEDWPEEVGVGKSVVILGAGIAGMTSAYEMNRLGYNCTVLEATARAGGRCRTIRAGDIIEETTTTQICNFDAGDDLYFNPGPARIPHHHVNLLRYCRHFNVPLEPFINDNRATLFHQTDAFDGAPQSARQVKADLRGYIAALLTDAANSGALDAQLSAADRASLTAMLAEFGGLNSDGSYTGSSRNGFVETEDQEPNQQTTVAALSLSEILNSDYWRYQTAFSEEFNQQASMLQPVGGMDRIAIAFEQQVHDLIRYSCKVTAIQKPPMASELNIRMMQETLVRLKVTLAFVLFLQLFCQVLIPIFPQVTNRQSIILAIRRQRKWPSNPDGFGKKIIIFMAASVGLIRILPKSGIPIMALALNKVLSLAPIHTQVALGNALPI